MRNISIIMIIVAVIMGALTVLAARSFLEGSGGPIESPVSQVEQIQTSTIVIATVPLKFGDEITADQLKEVDWPTELMPEGSFASISEIVGKERRVTLRSIDVKEPVVKSKISGFGFRASLSQVIGEGKRAVTIRVNDVASVGGFVLPGDQVDVLLSYQDGENVLDTISKIILQDVRVLAIDQVADEAREEAIVGKAATVEVSPEDAQKIALASRIGSLSLALRRISDLETVPDQQTNIIKVRDLKPAGGDVVEMKPKPVGTGYRRPKAITPKVVELDPAEMLITRGTKQTTENVERGANAELAGGAYPSSSVTDTQTVLSGFSNSVRSGVSDTTNVLTSVVGQ